MSTSEEFCEYVVDLLSPIGNIDVKKMFGGALLKVEGNQLGIIIGDTLYFKVIDVDLQSQYRELNSKQFSYTRKDKPEPVIIKNWWSVPESALESGEELVSFANDVLSQYNSQ